MSAKIVNMANPDEDETLCATVEEARESREIQIAGLQSRRTAFSLLSGPCAGYVKPNRSPGVCIGRLYVSSNRVLIYYFYDSGASLRRCESYEA